VPIFPEALVGERRAGSKKKVVADVAGAPFKSRGQDFLDNLDAGLAQEFFGGFTADQQKDVNFR